ncbi:MAG TPA: phosphoribosylamine--glycine ligase [Myxococcales bacterium]|nr:phosphoribosylamine--glycine ligase [Myxococcales bacterium]
MKRKVVVIGSGAREHALVRALLRAASSGGDARQIVAIPGNAGIALDARCVPSSGTAEALAAAALWEKPDLVVVGPEAPLADGLADRLAQAGIPCFGPTAAAARIEASKAFAKEVMAQAGVPTAAAVVFDDRRKAKAYVNGPCVVKLDGLAAGKGVIVCDDSAAALRAIDELWQVGEQGTAPVRLLIEERLQGPELSLMALTDGAAVVPLAPARDHKRLADGDRGPNTGGMGAMSPPRDATPELVAEIVRTVLEPTVRELASRGSPFRGALYAGLILTERGPRVLEFNCRLGDPEAQAILPRLRSDPLPLFMACAQGSLSGSPLTWDARAAVAVVIAAAGYPGPPRPGDEIRGLDDVQQSDDLWLLHAGTKLKDGRFVTAGGRLLTIAALGADAAAARGRAYEAAARIRIEGAQMRRDIAAAEVR